jgi:hypothetical protein
MGKKNAFQRMQSQSRPTRKKSAKELEGGILSLETRVRNAMMMLQMQLQQHIQRLVNVEQSMEMIDFRSLATLRSAVEKGLFTNEEHNAIAEIARIESFNVQSEQDNAIKFLKPAPEEALADGLVSVSNVEAFDVDGKKIERLSMLRSKVRFGGGEFPKAIEEQLLGAKQGETRSFTIECPPEMGPYAGQKVSFTFNVLQVLKADPPPPPAPAPVEAKAGDTTVTLDSDVKPA